MFNDQVRRHRHRLGLSQEELAGRSGVGLRTLRDLETARTGRPRPSTVRLLADAFGLTGPDREEFCRVASDPPDPAATQPAATQPAATPERPGRVVPAQLPADVRGFTGREPELAALDALLAGGDGPVVISAVSGTAGVGKTALAVHWAHRRRRRVPGRPALPRPARLRPGAAGRSRPRRWPASCARSGSRGGEIPLTSPRTGRRRYRSPLADRRMLLVLDNARRWSRSARCCPAPAACAVLVTSRDRLAGLVARHGAHRRRPRRAAAGERGPAAAGAARRPGVDAEPEAAAELAGTARRLPLALRIAAELAGHRPGTPTGGPGRASSPTTAPAGPAGRRRRRPDGPAGGVLLVLPAAARRAAAGLPAAGPAPGRTVERHGGWPR